MGTLQASFEAHFSEIQDPRREQGRRYPLRDILMMAVYAAVSDCDDWVETAECCQERADSLRTEYGIAAVPSHDTFRAVFARITPGAFEQCFLNWMKDVAAAHQKGVVAVDGKTLRRSHDHKHGQTAIETVSAWLADPMLVLAHQHVEGDTNEITTVPALLKELMLNQCIVTMDAAHCQTENTRIIVEQGGDYVLALKDNQGTLFDAVEQAFAHEAQTNDPGVKHPVYVTQEHHRGRIETRRYTLLDEADYIQHFNASGKWWQLSSVIQVERTRVIGTHIQSKKHFYICSFAGQIQKAAHAIRAHWGIENRQHYPLDVALHEDAARNRVGFQPENMAVVRRMALNLIRLDSSLKGSIKSIRKRAARNPSFAFALLRNAASLIL